MFYGPKLELMTEISTTPHSDTLRIDDTITNRGDDAQEFQILYHANYGPPLLEAGARFLGAVDTVTPFNDHAAASVDDYARYAAPTPGFVEQVYCITPLSGRDGKTEIGLVNRAGDKGVSMSYATDTLPYLTLWKNTPSLGEGYVTGLEPGPISPTTDGSNVNTVACPSSKGSEPSSQYRLHPAQGTGSDSSPGRAHRPDPATAGAQDPASTGKEGLTQERSPSDFNLGSPSAWPLLCSRCVASISAIPASMR